MTQAAPAGAAAKVLETVARTRERMLQEAAQEEREPVSVVRDLAAGGVPCRWYYPDGATRTILFVHGGGFVYGEPGTHDGHARRMANRTASAVLMPHYRRAPEDPYPAAVQDLDAVLAWWLAEGSSIGAPDGAFVAVGDSSGANLAQGLTLRHPGRIAAQVLVYPFLDPRGTTWDAGIEAPELPVNECRWYWRRYAPDPTTYDDVDLDPLRATDFSSQPPTLIQLAEVDVLTPTGHELARRMARDGVVPQVETFPRVPHGFWRKAPLYPESEVALAHIADFLDRVVGRRAAPRRTTPQ